MANKDALSRLQRRRYVLRVLLAGQGRVPVTPKDLSMLLSLQAEGVGGLVFEMRNRKAAEKLLAALETKLTHSPQQYELFEA